MNLSRMEENVADDLVEDDLVEDDRMEDVEIEKHQIKLRLWKVPTNRVDGHPPGNEKTYPTKRHNEKTSAQIGAGWQGIWMDMGQFWGG